MKFDRFQPLAMLACGLVLGNGAAVSAAQLYFNDFEHPTGFSDTSGRDVSSQTVNSLYGQPGYLFQQRFTVETLENHGGVAFGTGYQDPEGLGGNY